MAKNKFVSTLGNVDYTENLMVTNKSALDPNLDLFYKIGNRVNSGHSQKGYKPTESIVALAKNALVSDKELAVKIIGWSRSVRQGAGVRQHMRDILLSGAISMNEIDWEWFKIQGYWKDIFFFDPAKLKSMVLLDILQTIKKALDEEDNLILKWLPRKKKNKGHQNNQWIFSIREFLKLSAKEYRQICSSFKTTETYMCAGKWEAIDYNGVPSVCMNKNKTAFYKHDEARIKAHVEAAKEHKVVNGKVAKINVDALYPHQIIMPLISPNGGGWGHMSNWVNGKASSDKVKFAEAQWSQLKDKFQSDKKILVVGDTSGSMSGEPICISIALTVYCAERITGAFHNFACTFSGRPSFIEFEDSDSLVDKIQKIPEIVSNTNFEAIFDLILHKAIAENIPNTDMPEMILVISDMQFDYCTDNPNYTAMEMIRAKYEKVGYAMPQIVFWNVRNSSGVPATANQSGVVLFSGASVNSIKQAIEGEFNPMKAMLRVVDKEEFNFLKNGVFEERGVD